MNTLRWKAAESVLAGISAVCESIKSVDKSLGEPRSCRLESAKFLENNRDDDDDDDDCSVSLLADIGSQCLTRLRKLTISNVLHEGCLCWLLLIASMFGIRLSRSSLRDSFSDNC